MVPDVQSIREYQNFPNSYLLFTKVSMHLSISHSLCRRSSRSPIMLSILLVIIGLICLVIGASVSEPHLRSSTRRLSVYIYIYIYRTSVIFGPAAPALRANVSRLI